MWKVYRLHKSLSVAVSSASWTDWILEISNSFPYSLSSAILSQPRKPLYVPALNFKTLILSPVNDKCLTWFSGKERMAVETISWPISTNVIWLDMGSISWPLDWRQITDLQCCQLRYRARWICMLVSIDVCGLKCVCAWMCVCVCRQWMDGWTDRGCVCMRVCDPACVHVTLRARTQW